MRKYPLSLLEFSPCCQQPHWVLLNPVKRERMVPPSSTGVHAAHLVVTPDQVKWGPGPPSLPPGAQMAALEGDRSKAGRRSPSGRSYRTATESRRTGTRRTRGYVVLQGTFGMGLGERFDTAPAGRGVARSGHTW